MATIDVHIVGAFAGASSNGSPTGVVLNSDGLTDALRRQLVASVGCSHVAFVDEVSADEADLSIRFFTVAGEIRNCAHGTIAAHVLLEGLSYAETPTEQERIVVQKTASGLQRVRIVVNGDEPMVYLEQDAIEFRKIPDGHVRTLALALGGVATDTAGHRVCLASPGAFRFLAPFASPNLVRRLAPDFAALRRLCRSHDSIGCFAYALTANGDQGDQLAAVARMFAPGIGIEEDRVNGNSVGCLAALLLIDSDDDTTTLKVSQGHLFGTPSTVLAEAVRTDAGIRTTIGGSARIIETVSVML
jgi:PhzF family phenazine biosynthesis protein